MSYTLAEKTRSVMMRRLTVTASLFSLPDGLKAINTSRKAAALEDYSVALQIKMRHRLIYLVILRVLTRGWKPPLSSDTIPSMEYRKQAHSFYYTRYHQVNSARCGSPY